MKSFTIEGFKVITDIDECRPYSRMYDKDDNNSFEGEIYGLVMPVIEDIIISGKTAVNFFYDNCRGYRNRSLEPYNWRESKKSVKILYTGAMGGDPYEIEVFKS